MSRRRRSERPTHDEGQLPLNFDLFAIETPSGVVAAQGENVFDAGIRQSLVVVLDAAFSRGLSRDRVADLMSEKLCRSVNKAHLDLWTAPSQAERRIPVDALMALMDACSDFSPLEWIAHHVGRKVLTADEALCAEFGAMAVLDRHIKAKQKSIEGQMDEKLLSQLMHRMKRSAK
ncbi:hypothetical protein [Chromobacterium violaceum]|uniref:Uncharacterized protein n=1 Tax=Chromobacterium violaceum TaxID=536 RepID=A0AAX2M5C5_CHRVL|nr:hypothetical protein [Chromobacterium violaceum]OLZ68357.1 hypothetical protein BS642_21470 [Chromobacterium violaceum]STB71612.1 Uncharacterised protein [Chromobacterium violaceum]SUX31405.1 Uncharacterised protein [Chromobacterium violaceum]